MISLCWSLSLLRRSASAYVSTAFLISGCFVDDPDNSLTGSSLLPESLFQLHASDLWSHLLPGQAVTAESRSHSELSALGFCFCFTLWNCSCASVLRCPSSVGQLESSTLFLNRNLRLLDCFIASPLALWDLSLYLHAIVNLDDELRLGFLNSQMCRFRARFCACSCGASFIIATVSSKNQQWHLHLDDLFDDSLWDMLLARELRLRTAVFAGVVHVAQRIPWRPFV